MPSSDVHNNFKDIGTISWITVRAQNLPSPEINPLSRDCVCFVFVSSFSLKTSLEHISPKIML